MDRTLEDIRERFAEQIREARALRAALAQQKAKTNFIMNEIRAERQRMRDLVEQSHDVLWKHMRQ